MYGPMENKKATKVGNRFSWDCPWIDVACASVTRDAVNHLFLHFMVAS